MVRPGGDDVLTTDGPLAEANEQVGGFWVIETESLESAMEWARDAAAACEGPVEFARSQWVGDVPDITNMLRVGPAPTRRGRDSDHLRSRCSPGRTMPETCLIQSRLPIPVDR